jgi:hypothetical protein
MEGAAAWARFIAQNSWNPPDCSHQVVLGGDIYEDPGEKHNSGGWQSTW